MLVSRRTGRWAPGLLLGLSTMVLAADDELPEMELLEYLGFWEESDEEWVMFDLGDDAVAAEADTRTDPASQDKESTETDDEI
jgi:hypothetical protein